MAQAFRSPDGIFTRATTGSPHGHEEKGAARATLRIVNDRQEIDYSGARQTMGEDGGLGRTLRD